MTTSTKQPDILKCISVYGDEHGNVFWNTDCFECVVQHVNENWLFSPIDETMKKHIGSTYLGIRVLPPKIASRVNVGKLSDSEHYNILKEMKCISHLTPRAIAFLESC